MSIVLEKKIIALLQQNNFNPSNQELDKLVQDGLSIIEKKTTEIPELDVDYFIDNYLLAKLKQYLDFYYQITTDETC